MDYTLLTEEQICELLKGVRHKEVKRGVFRVKFPNRAVVHLGNASITLGTRPVYPDLKAKQCVYVGYPPEWSKNSTASFINCNWDGLYELAKHTLSQNTPLDLNFIFTYQKDAHVRDLEKLSLKSKQSRDKSPERQ